MYAFTFISALLIVFGGIITAEFNYIRRKEKRKEEYFEDTWKHLRQLEQQKKDLEETFEVMKTNNNVVWLKSSKIRVKD